MGPMRAVGFTEFGGPEVLRIISRPVPSPGPGQVRVRVAAAHGVRGRLVLTF